MKLAILGVLTLVLIPAVCGVSFNEVMYDLIGSDDNREWIEIVNEDNFTVNMQGWKFYEANTNHNLVLVLGDYNLDPGEFAVIAEDAPTFLANNSNFSRSLFDSSFSLSNTGETIVLKNKTGQIQDNLTYSYLWGGNENGYSVGLFGSKWKETLPSPGEPNQVSNICDWSVSIILDKLIFEDKTDFAWKVRTEKILGNSALITIKRKIEDIYGSSAKSYSDLIHNITNKETLSYDPNLNQGTYLLRAEINPSCNDSNKANNFANQLIAVKGEELNQESQSSLEIVNIYDLGRDKKAEFGQIIKAKIKAYRGNTTKQAISLWIGNSKEKMSKVFEFKVLDKFSEQEMNVPIQIFANCKGKLKEGNYDVVLEGLGEKAEKKIEIFNNTDDVCEKEIVKIESKKSKEQNSTPQSIASGNPRNVFNSAKPFAISTIMFESTQKKAEKFVPYAIAIIMSISVIFFVLSNKSTL